MFSTEQGIRLGFVKILRGVFEPPKPPLGRHWYKLTGIIYFVSFNLYVFKTSVSDQDDLIYPPLIYW
jgi:hypothetical protein